MSSLIGTCMIMSVGTLLLPACHSERAEPEARVGTASVTSAFVRSSIDAAGIRIAFAHCDQEMSCDHSSTANSNVQTCRDLVQAETTERLDEKSCPSCVNTSKLDDCVGAVQRTSCYDPIGIYERIMSCRASKLCDWHDG